jgi:hypothetical protein
LPIKRSYSDWAFDAVEVVVVASVFEPPLGIVARCQTDNIIKKMMTERRAPFTLMDTLSMIH